MRLEARLISKLQVVFLWNSAEWILFFWAAARLEMAFVPLDPRVLEQSRDDYIKQLKSSVVVIQDETAATALCNSLSSDLQDVKVRITCSKSDLTFWTSLPNLSAVQPKVHPLRGFYPPGQERALIIFTSGTTSTPKGCPHTAANLWSQSYDFDPDIQDNVPKWLVHTPVSHIFAVNNALRSFRYGGTVVFASKTFDIHASLKALELHQCTRMSAVPTLVQGLLSLPTFPGKDKLALQYVSLGGTLIKDADVQMCKRLSSDAVIQAYGMSEGAPITSWTRDDPLLETG